MELAAWWSVVASRQRRQQAGIASFAQNKLDSYSFLAEEALRNTLCNEVGLVESVNFKARIFNCCFFRSALSAFLPKQVADFECSGFDAFREGQVNQGTEPLTLPGALAETPHSGLSSNQPRRS